MRIGAYEVLRTIGGGGMAEAVLARAPSGRLVVLKRPLTRDADVCRRMQDEGRIGSRLFHPNLVETLDFFEHDGVPVIALGFVDGATLSEFANFGPLLPSAVATVGEQVAQGLSAIHNVRGEDGRPLGAIHRDVTARNVVVRSDGVSVLIDLGIAKSGDVRSAKTETGMVIGTLRYLAPEIVGGMDASTASDLWSLGVVLFELATGRVAFAGSVLETAARIASSDPLASEDAQALPVQLRGVLGRLLEKDVRKRIRDAEQAAAELRAVAQALGQGPEMLQAAVASVLEATAQAAVPQAAEIAPPMAPGVATPLRSSERTETHAFITGSHTAVMGSGVPQPTVRSVGGGAIQGAAAPEHAAPTTAETGPLAREPDRSMFALPPPVQRPPPSGESAIPAHLRQGAPLALELDTSKMRSAVKPKKKGDAFDSRQSKSHPQRAQNSKKMNVVVIAAMLGVALSVAGVLAYRAADAREKARKAAELDAIQVKVLSHDGEPECGDIPVADRLYMYENGNGTAVFEKNWLRVPVAMRKYARCVAPTR